eukprot:CAMPEP_0174237302 /NCGR_PEP_ID=MMETSP0417-20130205/7797_1 /TAXON_ID=242541 /ORGANISM="Mayorella sp, Strain BSH-02190019" /LENGTH=119 /DNA_ID=CAMNT_0015316045 /DNA_START=38 /DNA_END=394 /DNA_ORIENTATION=+
MSSEQPKIIFHLIENDVAASLAPTDAYRPESIASEGFIHLSTADQVVGTLNLFFKDHTAITLFHVDTEQLDAEKLKYENVEGPDALPKFPHYYDALPMKAVIAQDKAVRKGDTWTKADG